MLTVVRPEVTMRNKTYCVFNITARPRKLEIIWRLTAVSLFPGTKEPGIWQNPESRRTLIIPVSVPGINCRDVTFGEFARKNSESLENLEFVLEFRLLGADVT
jgi:hypothetical protein